MEEDILRVSRVVLPIANAAVAKTQEIFSGEPSMTLKASFRLGSIFLIYYEAQSIP